MTTCTDCLAPIDAGVHCDPCAESLARADWLGPRCPGCAGEGLVTVWGDRLLCLLCDGSGREVEGPNR